MAIAGSASPDATGVRNNARAYLQDGACFNFRRPVFTNRSGKLVSDQVSIRFGSTRRRHEIRGL